MNVLKINGVALPNPDPKPTHKVIAEHGQSYTDAAGRLHKTTIRAQRGRIDFQWSSVSTQEKDTILSMTKGQAGEWIRMEFLNPETNTWTIWPEAYAGDFEFSESYSKCGDRYVGLWDCKVGIIER